MHLPQAQIGSLNEIWPMIEVTVSNHYVISEIASSLLVRLRVCEKAALAVARKTVSSEIVGRC